MIVHHLNYSPVSPLTSQSICHSISIAGWEKYHNDFRGGERKIALDERALELPGVRILRPHCETSASSQVTRILICGIERLLQQRVSNTMSKSLLYMLMTSYVLLPRIPAQSCTHLQILPLSYIF
jgi:hypothetical protein